LDPKWPTHLCAVSKIDFRTKASHPSSILGDPGAVIGGRKRSKRARKNSGEEKSRTRKRAPGDKVLTDQFQKVGAALASDWCQKTFVFLSAQSQSSKNETYTKYTYTPVARHMCLGCSQRRKKTKTKENSRRKVPITAQNVGRSFGKKLAEDTPNLSQVS